MPAVSSSPITVLSRQLAPLGEVAPQARDGLLEVLESVPDPRKKRGVRHRFAAILFVSVCAVVSGARSFAAIAEWAADTVDDTLRGLGLGAPNASTIRRALSALTGDGFDTAIGDALHAQREHAEYLHRRGAHYVITVKGNQKTLRNQLAGLPWKDVPIGHRETDTGHGRRVTRTYKVVTIAAGIIFPHAAQAVQIVRTRKRMNSTKRATRETVYAVTSLTAAQTQPAELTRYIRGHWHVENKLHWVRDVTMGEDASRARTGGGPRMMASLRNLAISLLRLTGHTNIAKAIRRIGRKPKRAIKLITTS